MNKILNIIGKNLIFFVSGVIPVMYGEYSVTNSWQPWVTIFSVCVLVALRDSLRDREK